MDSNKKNIGVVIPNKRLFNLWKKEVGSIVYQDRYNLVMINSRVDIAGLEFHAIEKGYNFFDVKDFEEIYESAICRIR